MRKLVEKMQEFICDKRCIHACDNDISQDELDALCSECMFNIYSDAIVDKYTAVKYDSKNIEEQLNIIATETDCPVYLGDREVDYYIRLSDVIKTINKEKCNNEFTMQHLSDYIVSCKNDFNIQVEFSSKITKEM